MEELFWEQIHNNIYVTISYKEKEILFRLEEQLIIHLIGNSPKVYFFKLKIGSDSIEYLANFSKLKPIVKASRKLSYKVKSGNSAPKKIHQEQGIGSYTIVRGESFHNRFLGVSGWQPQEYLFNIVPLESKKATKAPKPTEKQVKKTEISQEKPTPKIKLTVDGGSKTKKKKENSLLQECKSCGNIFNSDYDLCPYCFQTTVPADDTIDLII